MLAKLYTFALVGIDAVPVEVEVHVSPGPLPKMVLVGLRRSIRVPVNTATTADSPVIVRSVKSNAT